MRYSVLVKFSTDEKLEIRGNEIIISIKSEPERGKANNELVKKLAKHFGVNRDHVRIVSGLMSRKKIIEVS